MYAKLVKFYFLTLYFYVINFITTHFITLNNYIGKWFERVNYNSANKGEKYQEESLRISLLIKSKRKK